MLTTDEWHRSADTINTAYHKVWLMKIYPARKLMMSTFAMLLWDSKLWFISIQTCHLNYSCSTSHNLLMSVSKTPPESILIPKVIIVLKKRVLWILSYFIVKHCSNGRPTDVADMQGALTVIITTWKLHVMTNQQRILHLQLMGFMWMGSHMDWYAYIM